MATSAAANEPKAFRESDDDGNTKTFYAVEHLATFSTTSSHEAAQSNSGQIGPTNEEKRAKGEREKASSSKGANEGADQNRPATLKGELEIGAGISEPRVALQKLFELEKLSGIWTQRMQIELQQEVMLIVDCETNAVVERFCKDQVTKPEAFSQHNDIYNNIIVFIIEQQEDSARKHSGELHIFQCVSHKAQQLVSDILAWKRVDCGGDLKAEFSSSNPGGQTAYAIAEISLTLSSSQKVDKPKQMAEWRESEDRTTTKAAQESTSNQAQDKIKQEANKTSCSSSSSSSTNNKPPVVVTAAASMPNGNGDKAPIVNVNVKETVQVFNQIAALREKR